jgi:hypothetical protein
MSQKLQTVMRLMRRRAAAPRPGASLNFCAYFCSPAQNGEPVALFRMENDVADGGKNLPE